ncbi:MAG TPA: hypothetical protein VF461_24155 [Gemmatimonadaceae bacterium]
MSVLVGQTDAGRHDERTTSEAFGYFGEFKAWAVFAHFYRSEGTMSTGQHFVQRDICLADLTDFEAARCDAQPFLQQLPEKVFYDKAEGATGPPWEYSEGPLTRPEPASPLSPEVLLLLLKCFLYSAKTILIWPNVRPEDITSILRYLPPVLRRGIRFVTHGADVTKNIAVQCFPAFKVDPAASIVEMPRGRVLQEKLNEPGDLPVRFVEAAQAGRLVELHDFIDNWIRARSIPADILVRSLATATQEYAAYRAMLATLEKPHERWPTATRYLQMIAGRADAAEKRRGVLAQLVRNVSEEEGDAFKDFFRKEPAGKDDMPSLVAAMAERLAGQPSSALIRLYTATFKATTRAGDLIVATVRAIPADRRRIEDLQALEKAFGVEDELPPDAIASVLSDWTFRSTPAWKDANRVLRYMAKSPTGVAQANGELTRQLQDDRTAAIALALLRLERQHSAGGEQELLATASAHPQETLTAALDGPAQGWKPNFLIDLLARAIKAAPSSGPREKIADLFVLYFRRVDDAALLDSEHVRYATQWAGNTDGRKRQVTDAQAHHELPAAEQAFRERLVRLAADAVEAWNPQALLQTLGSNERWSWYLAAALHDDAGFNLLELTDILKEKPEALPLLRMLASVILVTEKPRTDAAEVLSRCVEAISKATLPAAWGLRGQLQTHWTPSGHREYERMLTLVEALTASGGIDEVRQRGLRGLADDEPVKAATARLNALINELRRFANGPELALLKNRAGELDLREFKSAAVAFQKTLDDKELLEQLKAILGKDRRGLWW